LRNRGSAQRARHGDGRKSTQP